MTRSRCAWMAGYVPSFAKLLTAAYVCTYYSTTPHLPPKPTSSRHRPHTPAAPCCRRAPAHTAGRPLRTTITGVAPLYVPLLLDRVYVCTATTHSTQHRLLIRVVNAAAATQLARALTRSTRLRACPRWPDGAPVRRARMICYLPPCCQRTRARHAAMRHALPSTHHRAGWLHEMVLFSRLRGFRAFFQPLTPAANSQLPLAGGCNHGGCVANQGCCGLSIN